MADHMTAMTAEQLRAELERIAQWMHDQVETNEEQCSPGYSYRSGFDETLDAEAGKLRRIAARLSGMAADTWQPIETAPKDGSHVIAWWGGAWRVAYWLDNTATDRPWKGWKPLSMQPWPKGEPTHWMIPAAPERPNA